MHVTKISRMQQADRLQLEQLGARSLRPIAVRLERAVLKAYKNGQDPEVAFAHNLAGFEELLRDGMVASHLQGWIRSAINGGSKLLSKKRELSVYSRTINQLRQRIKVSPEMLDSVLGEYKDRSREIIGAVLPGTQERIGRLVSGVVATGVHVRQGMVDIRQGLAKIGVSPSKPWVMETFVRTQIHTAYGAGRWKAYQDPDINEILWGFQYVAIDDDRLRDEHRALNGMRYPKDHDVWQSMWPPNGYNCRCDILEIFTDEKDAVIKEHPETSTDSKGREMTPGPDPGWGFNAGVKSEAVIKGEAKTILKAKPKPSVTPWSEQQDLFLEKLYDEGEDATVEAMILNEWELLKATSSDKAQKAYIKKYAWANKKVMEKEIATFDRVRRAAPRVEGTVYRGLGMDADEISRYTQGKTVSLGDAPLAGRSQKLAIAKSKREAGEQVVLKIKTKTGADLSDFVDGEDYGVVLGKNSNYKVTKVRRGKTTLIEMEETTGKITSGEVERLVHTERVKPPKPAPKLTPKPAPKPAVRKPADSWQSLLEDVEEKDHIDELVSWGKKQNKWEKGMTIGDKRAIQRWAEDSYPSVRAYQQGGMAKVRKLPRSLRLSEKDVKQQVRAMKKITEQSPNVDGTVYRGMNLRKAEHAKYVEGNMVTMEATSSASRSASIAHDFAVDGVKKTNRPLVLKVRTKTGTDIGRVSADLMEEMEEVEEVLLRRKSKYRVVKVTREVEMGTHSAPLKGTIVELEEIVDEKTFFKSKTKRPPSKPTSKWKNPSNYGEAETQLGEDYGIWPYSVDLPLAETLPEVTRSGKELSRMLHKNKNMKKFWEGGVGKAPWDAPVGSMEVVKGSRLPNSKDAIASFSPGNKTITISQSKYAKDVSKLPEFGRWTVDGSYTGTFRHEIGHSLHSAMGEAGSSVGHPFYGAKKQWDKIEASLKRKGKMRKVSKYATSNTQEGFAESFSAYTHPQYKRGGLPKEIEQFMDKYIGE